ncbi:MAG: hypothetical protein WBM04_20225 [Candidatus Korobacteraceae bacterium]
MKTRIAGLCQLVALTLLVCCCFSVLASAQGSDERVTPRFVVLPAKPAAPGMEAPSATLATWNGSFTYNGHVYNYNMVGADPSTNTSVTVPTFIIPIKIVINSGGTQYTFDPMSIPDTDVASVAGLGVRNTAVAATITSPIFDTTTDYVQGGVDLGATQYLDAFQRGNFWSIVQNNPNTHVLVGGPTILPEQTLVVPAGDGGIGHPFGTLAGEVDINYFDAQINTIMTQFSQIQPNTFPIFETANVYLTQGGCCIGGYHSATGAQSYSHFTYINHSGNFSMDVSALSHEVGEWVDDPLVNGYNNVACGILEVGDPLEQGSSGHPYGTWVYPLHHFTYHLQDLTFLRYFGAPSNTSVNDWWSFQNFPFTTVCQNGG